ncbi:hypothetical protein BDV97DRAFT_42071 [Delphinella strobiligena]|nr:hypothetical protein BDV97DRAFT_42071 [Delphinella strobiligena]
MSRRVPSEFEGVNLPPPGRSSQERSNFQTCIKVSGKEIDMRGDRRPTRISFSTNTTQRKLRQDLKKFR